MVSDMLVRKCSKTPMTAPGKEFIICVFLKTTAFGLKGNYMFIC